MRTLRNYFLAAIAMVFLASVSALAQQGARRNATVTSRQETKAERKQEKVNEVQKPASVSNQSATDQRMRSAGGTSSNRRDGAGVSSGSSSSVSSNASSNDSRIVVGGGSGKASGSSSADSRIGAGSGGNKPSGGSVSGNSGSNHSGSYGGNYGSGSHNGSYGNGNHSGNHSGNYGSGYGGGNKPSGGNSHSNVNVNINIGGGPGYGTYPGGYNYPGMRPALPPSRSYDRYGIVTRTNASSIVIRTVFRTKAEAYDYVARLLDARYFTIGSYGNGYSWLMTDVTFIPTPFDWTNPMTHNQFRVRVDVSSSLFGGVKVILSGEWRESILSDAFSILRFQPSDRYSTYYAWSILEDIAENIPGTAIAYR